MLIAEQGALGTSYGGWLADEIHRRFFDLLDAPVWRVTGGEASPSISKVLERAAIAQQAEVVAGAGRDREVLTMARVLRMPGVAANATEAVLSEWLVEESGDFAAADAIATVETEKAAVDVEADAAGRVLKTLVPPGAQVEVGDPIAVLGDPGEQVDDLDALLASLGVDAGDRRRQSPSDATCRPTPSQPPR